MLYNWDRNQTVQLHELLDPLLGNKFHTLSFHECNQMPHHTKSLVYILASSIFSIHFKISLFFKSLILRGFF